MSNTFPVVSFQFFRDLVNESLLENLSVDQEAELQDFFLKLPLTERLNQVFLEWDKSIQKLPLTAEELREYEEIQEIKKQSLSGLSINDVGFLVRRLRIETSLNNTIRFRRLTSNKFSHAKYWLFLREFAFLKVRKEYFDGLEKKLKQRQAALKKQPHELDELRKTEPFLVRFLGITYFASAAYVAKKSEHNAAVKQLNIEQEKYQSEYKIFENAREDFLRAKKKTHNSKGCFFPDRFSLSSSTEKYFEFLIKKYSPALEENEDARGYRMIKEFDAIKRRYQDHIKFGLETTEQIMLRLDLLSELECGVAQQIAKIDKLTPSLYSVSIKKSFGFQTIPIRAYKKIKGIFEKRLKEVGRERFNLICSLLNRLIEAGKRMELDFDDPCMALFSSLQKCQFAPELVTDILDANLNTCRITINDAEERGLGIRSQRSLTARVIQKTKEVIEEYFTAHPDRQAELTARGLPRTVNDLSFLPLFGRARDIPKYQGPNTPFEKEVLNDPTIWVVINSMKNELEKTDLHELFAFDEITKTGKLSHLTRNERLVANAVTQFSRYKAQLESDEKLSNDNVRCLFSYIEVQLLGEDSVLRRVDKKYKTLQARIKDGALFLLEQDLSLLADCKFADRSLEKDIHRCKQAIEFLEKGCFHYSLRNQFSQIIVKKLLCFPGNSSDQFLKQVIRITEALLDEEQLQAIIFIRDLLFKGASALFNSSSSNGFSFFNLSKVISLLASFFQDQNRRAANESALKLLKQVVTTRWNSKKDAISLFLLRDVDPGWVSEKVCRGECEITKQRALSLDSEIIEILNSDRIIYDDEIAALENRLLFADVLAKFSEDHACSDCLQRIREALQDVYSSAQLHHYNLISMLKLHSGDPEQLLAQAIARFKAIAISSSNLTAYDYRLFDHVFIKKPMTLKILASQINAEERSLDELIKGNEYHPGLIEFLFRYVNFEEAIKYLVGIIKHYIKLITPRLAAGTLRNGASQGEQANAPLESPSARIYFAQAKYNQGKNTPGLAPGIFIQNPVLSDSVALMNDISSCIARYLSDEEKDLADKIIQKAIVFRIVDIRSGLLNIEQGEIDFIRRYASDRNNQLLIKNVLYVRLKRLILSNTSLSFVAQGPKAVFDSLNLSNYTLLTAESIYQLLGVKCLEEVVDLLTKDLNFYNTREVLLSPKFILLKYLIQPLSLISSRKLIKLQLQIEKVEKEERIIQLAESDAFHLNQTIRKTGFASIKPWLEKYSRSNTKRERLCLQEVESLLIDKAKDLFCLKADQKERRDIFNFMRHAKRESFVEKVGLYVANQLIVSIMETEQIDKTSQRVPVLLIKAGLIPAFSGWPRWPFYGRRTRLDYFNTVNFSEYHSSCQVIVRAKTFYSQHLVEQERNHQQYINSWANANRFIDDELARAKQTRSPYFFHQKLNRFLLSWMSQLSEQKQVLLQHHLKYIQRLEIQWGNDINALYSSQMSKILKERELYLLKRKIEKIALLKATNNENCLLSCVINSSCERVLRRLQLTHEMIGKVCSSASQSDSNLSLAENYFYRSDIFLDFNSLRSIFNLDYISHYTLLAQAPLFKSCLKRMASCNTMSELDHLKKFKNEFKRYLPPTFFAVLEKVEFKMALYFKLERGDYDGFCAALPHIFENNPLVEDELMLCFKCSIKQMFKEKIRKIKVTDRLQKLSLALSQTDNDFTAELKIECDETFSSLTNQGVRMSSSSQYESEFFAASIVPPESDRESATLSVGL